MKVFLSHVIADKEIVQSLKTHCAKHVLELLVAEHTISLNKTITDKIETMIKESKVALFLLTSKGNESKFVQQEIGYSQSINKPALYIVQKGNRTTGFEYGRDYIELDPEKPDVAIRKAINRLIEYWNKTVEIENNERQTAGVLIAGLVALALFSK